MFPRKFGENARVLSHFGLLDILVDDINERPYRLPFLWIFCCSNFLMVKEGWYTNGSFLFAGLYQRRRVQHAFSFDLFSFVDFFSE